MAATASFLLGIALLTGCASPESAQPVSRPGDQDTADCTFGGRTIAGLRDTFRQLSDQLNGIGPASARNDLADVKARIAQGMLLANQVTTTIDPAVRKIGSPLIGDVYQDVSAAGKQLHDALSQLSATLDGTRPPQGAADAIGTALDSLNGAITRMRTACPSVFPADAMPTPQGPRLAGAR
ncbi:hypothetical protein [Nocardia sp. NPDC052566]|uniref:hypothetical protein n=1 Tax=Nocardia sp. NPDC052566 TaxID=3364330 RepID=UPI0037CC31BB